MFAFSIGLNLVWMVAFSIYLSPSVGGCIRKVSFSVIRFDDTSNINCLFELVVVFKDLREH